MFVFWFLTDSIDLNIRKLTIGYQKCCIHVKTAIEYKKPELIVCLSCCQSPPIITINDIPPFMCILFSLKIMCIIMCFDQFLHLKPLYKIIIPWM